MQQRMHQDSASDETKRQHDCPEAVAEVTVHRESTDLDLHEIAS